MLEHVTKICSKCKTEKPKTEFRQKWGRPAGQLESWCHDCKLIIARDWKERHPEQTRELSRKSASEFFKRHPERVRANSRRHYAKNRQAKIKYQNAYIQARIKKDPEFKLTVYCRSRLKTALKGNIKSGRTIELLGCSISELKIHLESLFKAGMSWDNYGSWHIDHKRPCASFDLSDATQQRICFHYSNLQPLWAADNLSKSDKF